LAVDSVAEPPAERSREAMPTHPQWAIPQGHTCGTIGARRFGAASPLAA
jgi:hypothetical protein